MRPLERRYLTQSQERKGKKDLRVKGFFWISRQILFSVVLVKPRLTPSEAIATSCRIHFCSIPLHSPEWFKSCAPSGFQDGLQLGLLGHKAVE